MAEEKKLVLPNRNYKDRIFRLLFSEKENLLSLYNALNDTNYENVELLRVVTLENAVYMGMRNDVSFVFDSCLNLYEHQSTFNPNMALRSLQYIANQLEEVYSRQSLYSTRRIMIPGPKFVVFYNGTQEAPEEMIMKLSDSYEPRMEEPELELKVHIYNINYGYNKELMKKCRVLEEYSLYVDLVRKYAKDMERGQAVDNAIKECIKKGVLAEFLRKNRSEVMGLSIFEYDEEAVKKMLREEAYEDGFEEGRESGFEAGQKDGFEVGRTEGRAEGRAEGQNTEQLRIARSLLGVLPDEMIAEKIGIDMKTIKQIKKESKAVE